MPKCCNHLLSWNEEPGVKPAAVRHYSAWTVLIVRIYRPDINSSSSPALPASFWRQPGNLELCINGLRCLYDLECKGTSQCQGEDALDE
jgi:hypothetical protein